MKIKTTNNTDTNPKAIVQFVMAAPRCNLLWQLLMATPHGNSRVGPESSLGSHAIILWMPRGARTQPGRPPIRFVGSPVGPASNPGGSIGPESSPGASPPPFLEAPWGQHPAQEAILFLGGPVWGHNLIQEAPWDQKPAQEALLFWEAQLTGPGPSPRGPVGPESSLREAPGRSRNALGCFRNLLVKDVFRFHEGRVWK